MTASRACFDPSLYLVTDTAMCARRGGVVATVRAAVAGGVRMVQLRDPAASAAELVEVGRALRAELRGSGVPLIVNDRVELVAAVGADGAHIGQGDLDVTAARRVLGRAALLGLSVETAEQARAAVHAGADVDYLGVGPVWAQHTKADAAAPCGIVGLRAIADVSSWPCIAIGGIDAGRAGQVRAAGAKGMAVVSAICAAADPGVAAQQLVAAWEAAA